MHELYLTTPVRDLCQLLPCRGICRLSALHRGKQACFAQTDLQQTANYEQLMLASPEGLTIPCGRAALYV